MNEIRKAEIFSATIEEGYTCMIGVYILDDKGRKRFVQNFGGKKFYTYQEYETWKNGIENIINRKFEDSKGAILKVIIDEEDILGIGNLKENYWIVKEKVKEEKDRTIKEKTVFSFKTEKREIDEFFQKNNIEHEKEEGKENDIARE